MMRDVDYAVVGGGLAAGVTALAVRAAQPRARIAVIEREAILGGNHTWCFHAGDVPAEAGWLEPLVAVRWPGYDVRFAGYQRAVASPYACIPSTRLAERAPVAIDALLLDTTALAVGADHVDTTRGRITARHVIDARGPGQLARADVGWQVFLGQEVEAPGHGLAQPIVMDATIAQDGGLCFCYVLPLAADRLLIEHTSYADAPDLHADARRAAIAAYAAAQGWAIGGVVREETGALPLPLSLAVPPPAAPLVVGYGGGYFHPVTGYSLPVAVRLALAIARGEPAAIAAARRAHVAQLPFALRLNRMLFRWFPPDQRHHVLARFYRMPEPTIRRFYALELTTLDRARFFVGRPPRGLSVRAALGRAAR